MSNGRNNTKHLQIIINKEVVIKLSPLSPELLSKRGHVAHGESTAVQAKTKRRKKKKLKRDITIKLERLNDLIIKLYQQRADERKENLFLMKKAKKAKKRKLSLDSTTEQPPEYVVEKILNFKIEFGKEMFFIKWKGWDDSDNTWEPIESLDNCPEILRVFLRNEELKHVKTMKTLKDEISFDNLLSDENLINRFAEIELTDLPTLEIKLLVKLLTMIHLPQEEENHVPDLVKNTRNILQLYVATRRRCQQLIALQDWEDYLNRVDKSKKITVKNDVDLTGPPKNFTYINESVPGPGVTIPNAPPIGCECVSCNCRSKSCCGMQAEFFAYTVRKRLRVAPGTPIYECNKACKCSSRCNNRVVQEGRNVKLTIFRTSNDCGWGVRAEQKIKKGQFVCKYTGEIITYEEAEKRGMEYDAIGLTYLFDLDYNSNESPYVVDACNLGNISHFINHSCDPNLGVWAVWADCLDPNLPMLAFFATRDIEAGEELCFDYKCNNIENAAGPTKAVGLEERVKEDDVSVPSTSEASPAMASVSPINSRFEVHQQDRALLKNTECKCGTIKCRKYLF